MIRTALLVLATYLVLSHLPQAHSAEPQPRHAQCEVSYNKLRAAIEAAHDPDAREVVFAGADAQKIIDWVNARPPITDIHLDHIITVIHKDPTGDWVGIAFVKEGCVFHTGQVPLEDYTAMLTTVFGAGS